MNSSGIKRGLAATAISALAVTGLPALALSASATPIKDTLGANAVSVYTQQATGNVSAKNDGTNTTVSLLAGGGANVTSIQYQYQSTATGAAWNNIGAPVARNADGAFKADWTAPPADLTMIRAVPNTGLGNAVTFASLNLAAAANTVELASEGALGVFQEPYTDGGTYDATTSELLAVTGTVSQGSGAPSVYDASHTGSTDVTTLETTPDTTSDTFNSVVDIDGYPYSGGTDPNQIALAAETNNTDDAEASTLYVQTIGSISATPVTQQDVTPNDAEVTLTVKDTQGNPVAGAEVFRGADTDTDGAGPDTDTDGAEALVGYTDGRGQIDDVPGSATTIAYFANTTDNDAYQAGTDPTTNATVTTYTPVLTTVDIVNDRNRSNFDRDEVDESPSDDFHIETKDQNGNLYDEDTDALNNGGSDIEYRYIFDATGPTPATTTSWFAANDNGDGTWSIDDNEMGAGSYTIEARRPNVGGTGLKNAVPETYTASNATVSFNGGNSENAPVNGDFTATGSLTNAGGGLGGREVDLYYDPTWPTNEGGDATFAPQNQQPAGVTVVNPYNALVVTDANGNFAVKLSDPDVPPNVPPTPEDGELGVNDVNETPTDGTSLNTYDYQVINWQEQPEVDSIDIDIDTLYPNGTGNGANGGPGVPLDLDIEVFDADDNALRDFPVEVTVNKGFLSPNAEDADELTLADGHDSDGDLYGFFQNDGQTVSTSTGDDSEAGIVAAIERDAGFDDDGLVNMTITVTAGGVTETRNVTMSNNDDYEVNKGETSLERAAGEPAGPVPTDQELDFQYYVHDIFGNLIGESWASVIDDSTIADFRTDEDGDNTVSDYTTSGPGVTAFSNAPTTQTLMARNNTNEWIVDEGNYPDYNSKTITTSSDPIEWVDPVAPPKVNAALVVRGRNNGAKNDTVVARAINLTEGATVRLYKKTKKGLRLLQTATMNSKGNHKFKGVNDKNGRKYTKYVVKVEATDATRSGRGAKKIR